MKMAPTRRNVDGLLARVNFPLYTVQMLTSRHVLVGGGGGSSKTGVANGFVSPFHVLISIIYSNLQFRIQEVYELSHDGEKFMAEEVLRHETGPSAVMNCSTYNNNKRSYLAAGQESYCQLYNVQSVLVSNEEHIETIGDNDIRQRKPKPKVRLDSNENSKRLKFVIKPGDSVKTDFDGDDPLLRIVRICSLRSIMATGLYHLFRCLAMHLF